MPNHTVLFLAQSPPSRAEVLSRVLAKQAPALQPRVDEILGVIAAGVQDFHEAPKDASDKGKSAQGAMDTQLLPSAKHPVLQKHSGSAPLASTAKASKPAESAPAPKRLKPQTTVDVWAGLISGKKTLGKQAPSTSALFGKTLNTPASLASTSASASAPSSSLFGRTLDKAPNASPTRTSRQQSPGFASAQSTIHSALEKTPAEVPTIGPDAPNQAAEPETVAFVPAGERKIPQAEPTSTSVSVGNKGKAKGKGKGKATAAAVEAAPTESAPKVGPTVDADGVVAVRKQKKSKKDKVKAASLSAPGPATGSPAPQKKAKKKIKASDIPAFDYAAEGNLLDQPPTDQLASSSRNRTTKSKKKDKPQANKKGR